MRQKIILLILIAFFTMPFHMVYSQKIRLTIWNYYRDKYNISDQLKPLDGFCFKASESIRNNSGVQGNMETEVNMVHLIIYDGSSGKKYLCTGGFNKEDNLYFMRIRPEDEIKVISTEKNYFSPNICQMMDGYGNAGQMKFSRDRLSILDESDQLVGEFLGKLVSNDEIELFLYDRINQPEKEKIY